jgi:hypothetical protein
MKSEEIAVLRILYKHYAPIKLSTLVDGFPDRSKPFVMDAVSRLQLHSYLIIIDSSSELYVTINREMRRFVLDLLESDSGQHNLRRIRENEILQIPSVPAKRRNEHSCNQSSEIHDNGDVLLRLPRRAIKLGASLLVFSFVIVGVISVIDPQSTAINSISFGNDESTLPFMLVSSFPLANERQEGMNNHPVGHVYNSESKKVAYSGEPTIHEGFFTAIASSSYDEPRLYYHYIFSEKQGLVFLEPLVPAAATSGLNSSSLLSITDIHGKHVSLT